MFKEKAFVSTIVSIVLFGMFINSVWEFNKVVSVCDRYNCESNSTEEYGVIFCSSRVIELDKVFVRTCWDREGCHGIRCLNSSCFMVNDQIFFGSCPKDPSLDMYRMFIVGEFLMCVLCIYLRFMFLEKLREEEMVDKIAEGMKGNVGR